MTEIPKSMDAVEHYLRAEAGLGRNFDMIFRPLQIGRRNAALFFYNGFAKDLVLTPILQRLSQVEHEQLLPHVLDKLFHTYVPSIQIEYVAEFELVLEKVMAGASALFIEQERKALVMDTRQYPMRTPEEPSNEKVVRGSRDGFVETLLTNVALVRRRLRDRKLICSVYKIGERTNVDVALSYIEGMADANLISTLEQSLRHLRTYDLPLTDKQLEEQLTGARWSLFPSVRYSERPDVICSHLLEGHVVIFVDTSPSVMILPATYFHHLQHAEEYRNTPLVGTYLRWVRYIGVFASLFLLPVWFLFAMHPELLPEQLSFIGPREKGSLPLLVQFLIAEIGIDMMRMAAIHTPTPLATAMGLIAAILIGEIAVKVGLFVPEVILYVAIAAIGTFATPSYELSLANRMIRLFLLFAVALFGAPGLIVTLLVLFVLAARHKPFGTPFLSPLVPFNAKKLLRLLLRVPFKRR
jgi:stage V sporulation protein AF